MPQDDQLLKRCLTRPIHCDSQLPSVKNEDFIWLEGLPFCVGFDLFNPYHGSLLCDPRKQP